MIYLSGAVCRRFAHPMFGFMHTPRMGEPVDHGRVWAADNGRFSAPEDYTDVKFLTWLAKQPQATCLFAVAPDVYADHEATVALSRPLFPSLQALGYKAAFVAQNGWLEQTTPWDEFDVLFIGGNNEFKLGPAFMAVAAARRRGKQVHMGRVNSYRRLRLAAAIGCHSADGTFLKFGPDRRAPELLGWLDRIEREAVFECHW